VRAGGEQAQLVQERLDPCVLIWIAGEQDVDVAGLALDRGGRVPLSPVAGFTTAE